MHFSTSAYTATLLSLFSLASASPTPVQLAPRCGTTVFPTFVQALKESSPSTVYPNSLSANGDFLVSQSAGNTNRVYQIIGFENIPAGAYGCQLNVQFPAGYPITTTGNPTLNVSTIFNGSPANVKFPNNYSWSSFYPPTSPPFGQGLFGTVNLAAGQQTVVNSEACPTSGGNLAFAVSIASWIGGAASVEFNEYVNKLNGAGLAGFYLTHSC